MTFFRTTSIRLLAATALVLLVPAQALAHCRVPFAGMVTHDHHPTSASASPRTGHLSGALSLAAGETCTLDLPLFVASRAPDGGHFAPPVPRPVPIASWSSAAVAEGRSLQKPGVITPHAFPPLRI